MQVFRSRLLALAIAVFALCITAITGSAIAAPLVTPQQQELDKLALSLQSDPAIKTAREEVIRRWSEQPPMTTADGKASLQAAVDELVYHALRAAAADDPSRPKVGWTLAPGYPQGKQQVPGSRFAGDNPDRIYRYVAVDPAYRYEIRGQRGAKPAQHEFSFEATKAMSLVEPPQVVLYSKDIDVAKDGSFVVTADSSPAEGRRNHLSLPEGTKAILIRDTVPDWSTDYNAVTIARLDGSEKPPRSQEELVKQGAAIIANAGAGTMRIFGVAWKDPANEIKPFVRPYEWGVPGNVIAINRFSLQKDEALVITLIPSGANYLSVQLTDPWSRSIDYWNHSSSLSDHQTRPNADGSITFVLSAKDPGVYNWLDTAGFQDGVILARWELFPQPLPAGEADKLVREVRKVKFGELTAALPKDVARTTGAERKKQLKTRAAEFNRRIALK